jgi:hypothetical protein
MARTIDEIRRSITGKWMGEAALQQAYGFAPETPFETAHPRSTVEGVLTYLVAAAIRTLEELFDLHREEVDARLAELTPHRAKWYRDRTLAFVLDRPLIPDTDRFDTAGMSDEETAQAMVVKHAVAVESDNASLLTIKVAGETGGERAPLPGQAAVQLLAYLQEVKDAGVRLELVNAEPELFDCELDVYYDPILSPDSVREACLAAVERYIAELPFNGQYSNMALVDAVQAVEGARIVEFRGAAASSAAGGAAQSIDGRYTPLSGYFTPGAVTLNMKV